MPSTSVCVAGGSPKTMTGNLCSAIIHGLGDSILPEVTMQVWSNGPTSTPAQGRKQRSAQSGGCHTQHQAAVQLGAGEAEGWGLGQRVEADQVVDVDEVLAPVKGRWGVNAEGDHSPAPITAGSSFKTKIKNSFSLKKNTFFLNKKTHFFK